MKRIEASKWCAVAKIMHVVALTLAYSTFQNYAPVWCIRAQIRLIDSVLNDS